MSLIDILPHPIPVKSLDFFCLLIVLYLFMLTRLLSLLLADKCSEAIIEYLATSDRLVERRVLSYGC